jgi:hypothetical protein
MSAAFPCAVSFDEAGHQRTWLRDYFAAAALTGILAKADITTSSVEQERRVLDAYFYADLMLGVRA